MERPTASCLASSGCPTSQHNNWTSLPRSLSISSSNAASIDVVGEYARIRAIELPRRSPAEQGACCVVVAR